MKNIFLFLAQLIIGLECFAQQQHISIPNYNKRGDTLNVASSTYGVPVYDDNINSALYHYGTGNKNIQISHASMMDTTYLGGVVEQAHWVLIGHSFFQRINLANQHLVNYLESKFASAGPGWISCDGTNYGMTNVFSGWTTRHYQTSPVGKGPDTYSLVSAGVGTNITIAIGTQNIGLDYCKWTRFKIYYWGISTGGTFQVKIDGVIIDTVNTATGTMNAVNIHCPAGYQNLTVSAHTIVMTSLTEGSTHSEVLGFYADQQNSNGWIVDRIAKGSTTQQNFNSLDSATWVTIIKDISPTIFCIDFPFNNAQYNTDTGVMYRGYDTLLNRMYAANPLADKLIFGSTNYSLVTYPTAAPSVIPWNRTLKRLAQDSGYVYFDPIVIVGTWAQEAARGMVQSDSAHIMPQTSEIEWGEIMSKMFFSYVPPPIVQNFYQGDGKLILDVSNGRVVNGNNSSYLRFDSIQQTRLLGGTGLPSLTVDLTNPLQINMTGSVKFQFNQPIGITGTLTAGNGSGENLLTGYTDIGQNAGPGDLNVTSSVNAYSQVYVRATTTASYSDIILTNNATNNMQILAVGSTGLGGLFTANSATLESLNGSLVLASNVSSPIIFGTNATQRMQLTSGGNLLLGGTTNNASALLNVESTTQGSISAPSMTTTQQNAIISPAEGLHIYDNVLHVPAYYNGSAWVDLNGANIYNSDGTLTGNRTVTMGSNSLTFSGVQFGVATSGTATWNPSTQVIFYTGASTLNDASTASSGTVGNIYENTFTGSLLTATNTAVTYTNAYSVFINGSPVGGTHATVTNGYALGVIGAAIFQTQLSTASLAIYNWQTVTTGTTSTVNNNQTNWLLNLSSLAASFTVTLPAAPVDGQLVKLHFGGTISGGSTVVTALTVSANTGQTIVQSAVPTTALSGNCYIYEYNAALAIWYREQ